MIKCEISLSSDLLAILLLKSIESIKSVLLMNDKIVHYHTINIDEYKFRKSLGIKESNNYPKIIGKNNYDKRKKTLKKAYEIKNVTIKNNPKKFKKKFR